MTAAWVLAWFFAVNPPSILGQPTAPPLITLGPFADWGECNGFRDQYKAVVDELFGRFYVVEECTSQRTDPALLDKARGKRDP